MVIGLHGYSTSAFDGAAQGVFVAVVAALCAVEADHVEVIAVIEDPVWRGTLLLTVGGVYGVGVQDLGIWGLEFSKGLGNGKWKM